MPSGHFPFLELEADREFHRPFADAEVDRLRRDGCFTTHGHSSASEQAFRGGTNKAMRLACSLHKFRVDSRITARWTCYGEDFLFRYFLSSPVLEVDFGSALIAANSRFKEIGLQVRMAEL